MNSTMMGPSTVEMFLIPLYSAAPLLIPVTGAPLPTPVTQKAFQNFIAQKGTLNAVASSSVASSFLGA